MEEKKDNVVEEVNNPISNENNMDVNSQIQNIVNNNETFNSNVDSVAPVSNPSVSMPEVNAQVQMGAITNGNNLNHNEPKKKESKILFVLGVIVVIIGVCVEVGLFVYKQVNKENDKKEEVKEENKIPSEEDKDDDVQHEEDDDIDVQPEEEPEDEFEIAMREYGEAAEAYIASCNYIPEWYEVEENIEITMRDFNCSEAEVYEDGTIFLNGCSTKGGNGKYKYGINHDTLRYKLKYTTVSDSLYNGYTESTLKKLKEYKPGIMPYTKNESQIIGYVNNNYVEGTFIIKEGKLYVEFDNQQIEIPHSDKIKKVVDFQVLAHEIHIAVLDESGSIYNYPLEIKKFKTQEELIKYIKTVKLNKYDLKNNYTNIYFGYNELDKENSTPKLYATSNQGLDYAIDEEILIEEYFPYLFKGGTGYSGYTFEIDLKGKVFDLEYEDDSTKFDLGVKVKYLFKYSPNMHEKYYFLIGEDNRLYLFEHVEMKKNSDIRLKNSKVKRLHYKNVEKDTKSIIITFDDNSALTLDNIEVVLNEL